MRLDRRHLLLSAAATATAMTLPARAAPADRRPRRAGRLMAIGGAEDRVQDRVILRRFVELSGGPAARFVLLTAASGFPAATWASYEAVFHDLGAQNCSAVDARTPDDADSPAIAARLAEADGIFITGGDQRRLMACIAESRAERAIRAAFLQRGACVAGTSAGAAALSRHMLADGSTPWLPEKDAARLDRGLGLVPRAIIDQHFSERRRLGRLMSAVAQRPDHLGLGIDEDTALVIERGRGIEVIGRGAVTVLDGSRMRTNYADIATRERLAMLGVRLHLLPAGSRYGIVEGQASRTPIPASFKDALALLVKDPAEASPAPTVTPDAMPAAADVERHD